MAEHKGFDLAAALEHVSKSDTGREYIEYIDIDLIDDDPRNFYGLSDIDDLAANIELCGLQQPIRVRDGEAGRVVIVSGHRRRAAIRKLVAEGREDLRQIPCIRERPGASEALQELRLIYANSDTRRMTSAETSKQVERVEALLYQLKEEGYDFPGRMRDHVAEACKVSKTRLANLKTIRENLTPEWRELWENSQIPESLALTVARMPAEHQALSYGHKLAEAERGCGYYENTASKDAQRLSKLDGIQCPKGGPCTNKARKWEHVRGLSSWVDDSCAGKCCDTCADLGKCRHACPLLADKAKQLKAQASAQRREERERQAEIERPTIERIRMLWQRFGQARQRAGQTVEACYEIMGKYYSVVDENVVRSMEDGTASITTNTPLPYGYNCYLSDMDRYLQVADLLGCSLDYLFGRTDEPALGGSRESLALQWIPGSTPPDRPRWTVAKFTVEGTPAPIVQRAYYADGQWRFSKTGPRIDAECAGWFPIPEDEEAAQ